MEKISDSDFEKAYYDLYIDSINRYGLGPYNNLLRFKEKQQKEAEKWLSN